MDVEKIKALLLSVEKKSLSKAAEELSYTPSAFSYMVDSIENELGITIINRNFNGVELNDNGKILYDKLLALINAEKDLINSAKELTLKNQPIKIGAYSSIAQHLLPELIKQFKEENPTINVSIKIGNNLKEWINDKVADVIFSDSPVLNAMNTIKIKKDPYLILAPSTLLQGKKTATKEDLYDLPYISYNESRFDKVFEHEKFKEIIKFDSIDETTVIKMVENNIGIAVLPSLMLKKKSKLTHTVKLVPELSRTIEFSYSKESAKEKNVIKFIKFVQKYFK